MIVDEDSATYSAPWATAMKAGPPDESGQSLAFALVTDSPSLFSAAPALDATGRLTFKPAAETVGSTLVRVELVDTGGTANGGKNRSAVRMFRIKIGEVNDPPDPADDLVETPEDTVVVFDVLENDADIDGDPVAFVSHDGGGLGLGSLVSLDRAVLVHPGHGSLRFGLLSPTRSATAPAARTAQP